MFMDICVTIKLMRRKIPGFTLVELIVAISVIGILASIVIVSYPNWQNSIISAQLKSDLNGVASAMESARTFNNSYPTLVSNLTTFKPSKNTILTGGSSDGVVYCIDASSSQNATIHYYIDQNIGSQGAQLGTCASRSISIATAIPTNLIATAASSSSINVSWNASAGATSYTLQRGSNSSFTSATTIATQAGSTFVSSGLAQVTPYYYRVQATDANGTSNWSTTATATTTIDAPVAPTVTAATVGATTTWSWGAASCPGNTARYQYRYTITPSGYDSGWVANGTNLSVAFTTSTGGQTYTVAAQAQCYNTNATSTWSESGSANYYRVRTWTQITGDSIRTCAVASDNQAYCWGHNGEGELGNNSTTNSSIPVAVYTNGVLNGKTVKSISVGTNHTCVIASDDQVYCWGLNSSGQLGNNSTNQSMVPVAVNTTGVLSGKTIKAITAGSNTCAIASDNQAYCWGDGSFGQSGDNHTNTDLVPVAVYTAGVLSGKTIKAITAGAAHICAIASDNQVYCWGLNYAGSLGNNSDSQSSIPVAVYAAGVLNGKTIKSVVADHYTTCVITFDSGAYCWGYNYYGGLGNNSTTNSFIPVTVINTGALSGKMITSISAGPATCAIASDNQAYCWGWNGNGQLGNNSTVNSLIPVAVIPLP